MNLEQLLDALYASENNVTISCFWDAGWDIGLGDQTNGFVAQGNVDRAEEILPWLVTNVQEHLPEAAATIKEELPAGYTQWAAACNKIANQPFGTMQAPLLPCPNDPERFWVLYQGVRILKHWSEIPALWATSSQL